MRFDDDSFDRKLIIESNSSRIADPDNTVNPRTKILIHVRIVEVKTDRNVIRNRPAIHNLLPISSCKFHRGVAVRGVKVVHAGRKMQCLLAYFPCRCLCFGFLELPK